MSSILSSPFPLAAHLVCGAIPLTALFYAAAWDEHRMLLILTTSLFLIASFTISRRLARPSAEQQVLETVALEKRPPKALLESLGTVVSTMTDSANRLGRLTENHQQRATTTTTAAARVTESATIIAGTVAEMKSSIKEIGHQAETATQVVQTAVEKAAAGEQAITVLAERTQQIVAVVSFITAIAERTNLLALNASIEAARAGQHGRGFVVVAQEVKSLAKQVSEATAQIKAQMESIQLSSQESQRQMQEIQKVTRQINDATLAIKNALQQQTLATGEISANAQATMAATNDVTTSLSHLLVTTEEIRRVGEDVSAQVQSLQESVG